MLPTLSYLIFWKFSSPIPEDDVVGGTDDLRRKILRLFSLYDKQVDKSWRCPDPPPPIPTAPPAREKTLHDEQQRVAVVEPDEALDLL